MASLHAGGRRTATPRTPPKLLQGAEVTDSSTTHIATFSAIIPPIKSAILIGEGAQVKFDVDESGIPELAKLATSGRGRELVVSVFEKVDV